MSFCFLYNVVSENHSVQNSPRGEGGLLPAQGLVVSYWRKYVHQGLSLSRKKLVRLTNRPDMTIDVNRGRKTTTHATTLFPWGKSTIPVFA